MRDSLKVIASWPLPVESLGTPQLDIDAGAVSDANDNEIAASPDNAIAVDDTAPPVFSSATYSTGSGQLAITFSESLNGTVHLDRLHVRDSGESAGRRHALRRAGLSPGAP